MTADTGFATCVEIVDADVDAKVEVFCAGTKLAKTTSAATSALDSPNLTSFVFDCIQQLLQTCVFAWVRGVVVSVQF